MNHYPREPKGMQVNRYSFLTTDTIYGNEYSDWTYYGHAMFVFSMAQYNQYTYNYKTPSPRGLGRVALNSFLAYILTFELTS